MAEKYLLFDLNDEKSKKLGEVLGNETCKKIINLLAEKEQSASELSKELGTPLNTTTYNIKKLVGAGLIEEARSFWSVKGKKMPSYKIVNKAIVISPKKGNIYNKIKGVLPVLVTGIVFSGFILWENVINRIAGGGIEGKETVAPTVLRMAANENAGSLATGVQASSGLSAVSWFLIGVWVLLLAFVAWSVYKKND